jgi:Cupin domain
MANKLVVKHFAAPDETRNFPAHGRMDVLNFEGGAVGRGIFEPGWKWSKDMRAMVGTDSCKVAHSCYVLSGRMHLKMDSGEESDVGPGDFALIPPGHDAWTVGSETCVIFDFGGAANYAQPRAGAAQTSTSHPPTSR